MARLEALTRRRSLRSDPVTSFDDGTLHIDFAHHEVTIDGTPVVLTPIEYRLLAALANHRGQVLSPDQLLELAWDDPSGLAPGKVKYAVKRLRRGARLGRGRRHTDRDGAGLRLPIPTRVRLITQAPPACVRAELPHCPGSEGDTRAPCSGRRWGQSAVDRPSAKSDSVVTFESWPVSHGESK